MNDVRKVRMKISCKDIEADIFDNTSQNDELFVIRKHESEVFPKIQEAVFAKDPGDKFEILLAPSEAFGDYDNEALKEIPLKTIPEDDRRVGSIVEFEIKGELYQFKIHSVDAKNVTLDVNHPLAGESLVAAIEIVE